MPVSSGPIHSHHAGGPSRVIQGCFPGGKPRILQASPASAPPAPATVQARTALAPTPIRPGRPPNGSLQPAPRPGQPPRPIPPASALKSRPPQPATPPHSPAPRPVLPPSAAPAAVQPHAGDAFALPASFVLKPRGSGQPLPPQVQTKMETFFNTSFADVRVHVGHEAPSIGALAFTHGADLYFAPGQYNPQSPQGQQLLGHELTHVVQQRAGRVRNPLGAGVAVVQDPALEAEAESMGRRAASAARPTQAKPAGTGPIGAHPQATAPRANTTASGEAILPARPPAIGSMQRKPGPVLPGTQRAPGKSADGTHGSSNPFHPANTSTVAQPMFAVGLGVAAGFLGTYAAVNYVARPALKELRHMAEGAGNAVDSEGVITSEGWFTSEGRIADFTRPLKWPQKSEDDRRWIAERRQQERAIVKLDALSRMVRAQRELRDLRETKSRRDLAERQERDQAAPKLQSPIRRWNAQNELARLDAERKEQERIEVEKRDQARAYWELQFKNKAIGLFSVYNSNQWFPLDWGPNSALTTAMQAFAISMVDAGGSQTKTVYKAQNQLLKDLNRSIPTLFQKRPPPAGSGGWLEWVIGAGGSMTYSRSFMSSYEGKNDIEKEYNIILFNGVRTDYVVHVHWKSGGDGKMYVVACHIKVRDGDRTGSVAKEQLDDWGLPTKENETFASPPYGMSVKK